MRPGESYLHLAVRPEFPPRPRRTPRSVQLINVDAIQAQSLEAALDRFAKVFRSCIVSPLIWTRTIPASLGRNHQTGRVRKQRLGNQFLTCVRVIRIGSVDKVYVQFHGTA